MTPETLKFKMPLLFLALLASSQAFANHLQTCASEVSKECGRLEAVLALSIIDSDQCAIIPGGILAGGSSYAKKVIFSDSNTLLSIETTDCQASRIDIHGEFKAQQDHEGRLFNLTEDGQVVIVDRDNKIVYLLNRNNRPFTGVTNFKFADDTMILFFADQHSLTLNGAEILERLNNPAALVD